MNKDMPLIVNNNHAIGVIILTLHNYTYFSFSDWSTFWNQTTKNSTEFHTDPHNTKLEAYRHLHLHGLLQHPQIPSITMLFGCVNWKDIYTVSLHFITTNVVI